MEPMAIVGMSCRFPGAPTLAHFWGNLRSGVESISSFSAEDLTREGIDPRFLRRQDYVNAGGVLDNIELFDSRFFGMTVNAAATLDPQHRIFLEVASEALEIAGYDPDRYDGSIAVWAGASPSQYADEIDDTAGGAQEAAAFERALGTNTDGVALRTAYTLNLRGPVVTEDAGGSGAKPRVGNR